MFKKGHIIRRKPGSNVGGSKQAVMHTVLCANGSYITVKIGRKLAISMFCTECLGFETHPENCTSSACPLFPFRAKTRLTMRGTEPKPEPIRQPIVKETEN